MWTGAVGGALGVLPGSSGVLPGTGRPLPRRTWYVSLRRRGAGGGTRRVARVVWRVAGHRSRVATSYVVRFFTPSECGRGDSACCRAHPGCCRIVVGRFPCRPGCYARRLAHAISSAGVGRARRAGFLARSRSNEELSEADPGQVYARQCTANAWYALGAARLRQRRRHEAESAFEQALAPRPDTCARRRRWDDHCPS